MNLKVDIYAFENYLVSPLEFSNAPENFRTRGHKNGQQQKVEAKIMKTPKEKLFTLRKRCMDREIVQSVEGVLLVHLHRHPHVLLLRQSLAPSRGEEGQRMIPSAASNNPSFAYRLPGGRCRRGEKPEDCLLRKLWRHLLNEEKPNTASSGMLSHSETIVEVAAPAATSFFRVGEALSKWYRPHLNPLIYPYIPPHIAPDSLKEVRTVFLVHMERSFEFQVPFKDVELVAVPLFDLHENPAKYGPQIVSIPTVLSRVFINCCSNVEF